MGNKNSRQKSATTSDTIKDKNSVTGELVKNIKALYKFEKELGSGHFGKCYLCEQHVTSRKAAVKVIRKRCLNTRTLDTLKNEVEILSKVGDHPNVRNSMSAWKTNEIYTCQWSSVPVENFSRLLSTLQTIISTARDTVRLLFETVYWQLTIATVWGSSIGT